MICPKCKIEVDGASVFCPECGSNMMETVSDTDQEVNKAVSESAEVAFEETQEKTDWENDKIAESNEATPETVSVQADNVYAPLPEAVVVTSSDAPGLSQAGKKEKKKNSKIAVNVDIPKEYKPFTTGGAFWYLFLLGIPIVGFISLIIFAFAGKNKNRKSVARAILIFSLICLVISVALTIFAYIVFGYLIEDIMDAESVQEIIEIVLQELELMFG